MSEVIAKASKIAFFVILAGILASFLAQIVTIFLDLSYTAELSRIPVEITDALLTGRRVANNFIVPKIFNACIALWFTGSATLITNYALHAIASKIAGINN